MISTNYIQQTSLWTTCSESMLSLQREHFAGVDEDENMPSRLDFAGETSSSSLRGLVSLLFSGLKSLKRNNYQRAIDDQAHVHSAVRSRSRLLWLITCRWKPVCWIALRYWRFCDQLWMQGKMICNSEHTFLGMISKLICRDEERRKCKFLLFESVLHVWNMMVMKPSMS